MANVTHPSDDVAAAARECAQALFARLPEFAREWTELFVAAEPRLVGGPNGFAGVVIGAEQQSGLVLSVLAFGVPVSAIEMSSASLRILRQAVANGADLADLLRLYNYGHQFGWQMWSEHVIACVADPTVRGELLAWSGSCLAAIWGRLRELITDSYQAELASGRTTGHRGGSVAETLEDVLGSGLIDLPSASATLGVDLTAHHIALVLAPLGDTDVRPAITQLGALGAASLVSHPESDGTWSLWLSWLDPPDAGIRERISSLELDDIVAGLGEPSVGRTGFRRSHRQASVAVRTALLKPAPTAGVMQHRDTRLASALCADPARARLLADELLGELGADTDHCGRLRETLLAYLSHACNKTATAQALHVHHKTVTYRLDQVEELLGCAVTDNPLEIGAALLIKRTLGA